MMSYDYPEWMQEIREREQAATPGPWVVDALGIGAIGAIDQADGYAIAQAQQVVGDDKKHSRRRANTQFIAHARTDIPRLLDYIAALQKELDEAITLLENYYDSTWLGTHTPLYEQERRKVAKYFGRPPRQETTTNKGSDIDG